MPDSDERISSQIMAAQRRGQESAKEAADLAHRIDAVRAQKIIGRLESALALLLVGFVLMLYYGASQLSVYGIRTQNYTAEIRALNGRIQSLEQGLIAAEVNRRTNDVERLPEVRDLLLSSGEQGSETPR